MTTLITAAKETSSKAVRIMERKRVGASYDSVEQVRDTSSLRVDVF